MIEEDNKNKYEEVRQEIFKNLDKCNEFIVLGINGHEDGAPTYCAAYACDKGIDILLRLAVINFCPFFKEIFKSK